ncbi:MAG: hypothetical protein IAE77_10540 [Prosthecobacter sp.]|nr:hypothetical protein [Prosthecobacter sp.]
MLNHIMHGRAAAAALPAGVPSQEETTKPVTLLSAIPWANPNPNTMKHLPSTETWKRWESGKIGYILLWLLGIPLPVLLIIYLLRGD